MAVLSEIDRSSSRKPWRWTPHAVALLATVFTWPLLFVGGLVTTYKVGMAVPDWPTTFGINMFLYDMSQAAWGVLVEHGHRLYGAAVGLGCIALAFWYTLSSGRRSWIALVCGLSAVLVLGGLLSALGQTDPLLMGILTIGPVSLALAAWFGLARREWLVASSWLLLGAVIGQGALGGLRVRWNSTDLAAIHGCTGQLFFAAMVTLSVVSGRIWQSSAATVPDRFMLRWSALALVFLIYGQIVAGAWLRHFTLGLAIHSSLAVVVLLLTLFVGLTALRHQKVLPEIVPASRGLLLLTSIQLGLGLLSWWMLRPFDGIPKDVTPAQALIRTAHQANGALVLAVAVILALRCFRGLLRPAVHSNPSADIRETSPVSSLEALVR